MTIQRLILTLCSTTMSLVWTGQWRGPPPPETKAKAVKNRKRKRSVKSTTEDDGDESDETVISPSKPESSADERKQKKVKTRAPKRRKPAKAVMQLPFELQQLQGSNNNNNSSSSNNNNTEFKSASELMKDAPYLDMDMKSPARCVGPSDAKKQADQNERERLHLENPMVRPELEPTFMSVIKKLPVCALNQQVHGRKIPVSDLLSELKKGNVDLVTQDAQLEQELMVEAGEFETKQGKRTFPACMNGEKDCASFKVSTHTRVSSTVRIPGCSPDDLGSIPGRGSSIFVFLLDPQFIVFLGLWVGDDSLAYQG
jgi:hypothetical protein